MSPSKFEEFTKLALSLYDWLQKNYNPHTSVVITCDAVKIVSDDMSIPMGVQEKNE